MTKEMLVTFPSVRLPVPSKSRQHIVQYDLPGNSQPFGCQVGVSRTLHSGENIIGVLTDDIREWGQNSSWSLMM